VSELKQKILTKMSQPTMAALATITVEGKPWVRYVTPFATEDMTIRFATGVGTRKAVQIKANPEVHLTLGVVDPMTAESYMQIQGRAAVKTDAAARQAVWFEQLKAYFSGPDDPNMAAVEITPYRIEFMTMGSMTPEVWEA